MSDLADNGSCSSRNSLSLSPQVHCNQYDDNWRMILCEGILVALIVYVVDHISGSLYMNYLIKRYLR